jgi:AraC-like DNA-binding protein
MKSHRHPDFHELIVVADGVLHVDIDGGSHCAEPGDVLFYRQGHPHAETTRREAPVGSFFLSFAWDAAPEGIPLRVMDEHGRIRELVHWMAQEQTQAHPGNDLVLRAFLAAALAEWLRLAQNRDNPLTSAIRAFVVRHISEPITLERLASVAGMSKYHFLRRYRQVAGVTPMADVRRLRAEHAHGLILSTDLPLKSVAVQSGLDSHVHLARVFRQRFGMAPSRVRASLHVRGT